MLRVVVLVSGGGTNLQALIDSIKDGRIKNAEITRVISSSDGAYALKRAEEAGIKTEVVSSKEFSGETYDEALLGAIDRAEPDLIVLAGFLKVLGPGIVERYENRIINIHPSLIPSFCGRGYYGLKVHEEVLKKGVRLTGATVHFVDDKCDNGPILLQKAVEVRQEDTPESLQKRVMEEAEWILLPKAVELIAQGRVEIKDGRAVIKPL